MTKILAFAGSNSSTSINHTIAAYVASLIQGHEVEVLRLSELNIPMYGIDKENERGIPESAQAFFDKVKAADAIVLSVAEHNSNVTAYFKSSFDWLSRIDPKFLAGKKALLLSTSGGGRGAMTAREIAEKSLVRFGAEVVASIGIPKYGEIFVDGALTDNELNTDIAAALGQLMA
jgi:NAD(P)H-dependent FMN reductase